MRMCAALLFCLQQSTKNGDFAREFWKLDVGSLYFSVYLYPSVVVLTVTTGLGWATE